MGEQEGRHQGDDFFTSSIEAAEAVVDEYDAERYGSRFAEVRALLEAAKEVSEIDEDKAIRIRPSEDRERVFAAHYIGTDVFAMMREKTITLEGYNYLLKEYGTWAQNKPKQVYESGQATYNDVESARANDRLET